MRKVCRTERGMKFTVVISLLFLTGLEKLLPRSRSLPTVHVEIEDLEHKKWHTCIF